MLWQEEFVRKMKHMGFEQLHEDKCVFTDVTVIAFFYVDDIALLARPEDRLALERRRKQLKTAYDIRDLGDLRWFLSIRIIRKREKRLLWLCQDSYVEKLTHEHLQPEEMNLKADTPLSSSEEKNESHATATETKNYQKIIGSVLYAAIRTRPDISFSVGYLSTFSSNPSPKHF